METEYKWVKQAPVDLSEKKALLRFFRPAMPVAWKKNPREWLDSFNIEDVLKRNEEAKKVTTKKYQAGEI